MDISRRTVLRAGAAATFMGAWGLAGCGSNTSSSAGTSSGSSSTAGASLAFNPKAWHYDASNDVYWQVGNSYVAKPAASDYETLGVYVPGAYLSGTRNSDGTYTAQRRRGAECGDGRVR